MNDVKDDDERVGVIGHGELLDGTGLGLVKQNDTAPLRFNMN